MNTRILQFLVLLALVMSSGCSATRPWWLFPDKPDRTSYRTASMRMDAVREIAQQGTGLDDPEQRELTDQLARQIQIEPDPLVREAIVDAMAEFGTPMSSQVLEAALSDTDPQVRRKCCVALGKRGDAASVELLAQVVSTEPEHEVRIAAVDALGKIKSPESIKALSVALEDSDPAMQYAGVRSLQSVTGRDYGGDVSAWLDYARGGEELAPERETSVAERIKSLSPFK